MTPPKASGRDEVAQLEIWPPGLESLPKGLKLSKLGSRSDYEEKQIAG
jgi:hypothetical protein